MLDPAGDVFLRLPAGHDLRLEPAHSLVVLQKVWTFSETEHRVAGTNRGGSLLRGHYRFNFVKVSVTTGMQRNIRVGYMQLRALMKIVDRRLGSGGPKLRVARELDGKLAFLGRWLEQVPDRNDATGAVRLRWATPPPSQVIGHPGSELSAYWFQILDAETILESVQVLPIPMDPIEADTGQDSPERTFYLHSLGKSAHGEI